MKILVDYNNIKTIYRERGLSNLVDRIIHSIVDVSEVIYDRYEIKLYGGWFQGQMLSRRAQMLISHVNANFPTSIILKKNGYIKTSIINVDLAQTLEIDPKEKIYDTYRKKGVPHGIKPKKMPFQNCGNSENCSLLGIRKFFKKNKCPKKECQTSISDVIEKGEQKLVDTMLTADLIFLSQNGESEIAIVTSDDDMWPGIKTSLMLKAKITHVHTHSKRVTPRHYNTGIFSDYTQINMK